VFLAAFGSAWLAILKVFLVIVAAGLLVRRGILGQNAVSGLSDVTVVLFLPCLIFSKVATTLDPSAFRCGGRCRWPASRCRRSAWASRPWRSGASCRQEQHAGGREHAERRLPRAPVGLALYPSEFDRFALYCFLFILGSTGCSGAWARRSRPGAAASAAGAGSSPRRSSPTWRRRCSR